MKPNRASELITQLIIREQKEKRDREQPRIQPYAPSYLEYLNGTRENIPEDKPQRGVLIISL